MWSPHSKNVKAVNITQAKLLSIIQEPLNVKFLRALEKTRSKWNNDKQFTKIVEKMKKGKNLKRKEFETVYLCLREYCPKC